jgi:hypothetical protein
MSLAGENSPFVPKYFSAKSTLPMRGNLKRNHFSEFSFLSLYMLTIAITGVNLKLHLRGFVKENLFSSKEDDFLANDAAGNACCKTLSFYFLFYGPRI